MNDEYTVFDNIIIIAQNELGLIQDEINVLQIKMNEYRTEQKRLKAIIKAARNEPANNTKPKSTKPAGIRLATREKVMNAIRQIESRQFTVQQLFDTVDLSDASIARAIIVLRDEGFVRHIGMEGRAMLYKWVDNG